MGDSALASPELALVDADLAAELRRGLRPPEETWLRPRVRAEATPAATEKALTEPVVADELPLVESQESDNLPDLDYIVEVVEEAPASIEEDEVPQPVVEDDLVLAEPRESDLPDLDYIVGFVEEAPAAFEEDEAPQAVVADDLLLAEPRESNHLPDLGYIVEVVEQAPALTQETRSHYPVLPEPEEEVIEETDAALRRIREHMTVELPASERKLRRRFILASGASAACAVGVLALDVQLQVAQLPGWLGF